MGPTQSGRVRLLVICSLDNFHVRSTDQHMKIMLTISHRQTRSPLLSQCRGRHRDRFVWVAQEEVTSCSQSPWVLSHFTFLRCPQRGRRLPSSSIEIDSAFWYLVRSVVGWLRRRRVAYSLREFLVVLQRPSYLCCGPGGLTCVVGTHTPIQWLVHFARRVPKAPLSSRHSTIVLSCHRDGAYHKGDTDIIAHYLLYVGDF